jgi:hypothetical protein
VDSDDVDDISNPILPEVHDKAKQSVSFVRQIFSQSLKLWDSIYKQE